MTLASIVSSTLVSPRDLPAAETHRATARLRRLVDRGKRYVRDRSIAGLDAMGGGLPRSLQVPAALGNAVFDATGARLRDVPFTPARVRAALRDAGAAA